MNEGRGRPVSAEWGGDDPKKMLREERTQPEEIGVWDGARRGESSSGQAFLACEGLTRKRRKSRGTCEREVCGPKKGESV